MLKYTKLCGTEKFMEMQTQVCVWVVCVCVIGQGYSMCI